MVRRGVPWRVPCGVVLRGGVGAPVDRGLPFLGVAHHNGAALGVVLVDAHLEHVVTPGNTQLLVDLKLDWQAVAVPSKPAGHMVASLVGPPADDVLDGAGKEVAIVRQAGGKWWAVVE